MPKRAKVVILGAGQPYQRGEPSALAFTSGDQRVLDWVMAAFAPLEIREFHFVGGYRIDEIIRAYPQLHFSVNDQWATSGSAASLLVAPIGDDTTTYVCYADIVFAAEVVERVHAAEGDVVVGIDTQWQHRYAARTAEDMAIAEKVCLDGDRVIDLGKGIAVDEADAEYAGLCKLSPAALGAIDVLRHRDEATLHHQNIPALLMYLKAQGLTIRAVDVRGRWAELNQSEDLAHFVIGTKAETLANLAPMVRLSVIGDVFRFTVGSWRKHSNDILSAVATRFAARLVAVRSSTTEEDGWAASGAGRYRSQLNVSAADATALAEAIDAVVASYGDNEATHQVLVQPMLSNVRLSGVLTTRTLNHGAPQITVNFDTDGAATDRVTSGTGAGLRTLVVSRARRTPPEGSPKELAAVIAASAELEQLVGHDALDIEFAVTADGVVHVLQVRPIAVPHGFRWLSDDETTAAIAAAADEFRRRTSPPPHLVGRRTLYGVMPDWNPAEIIGPKPRPLALSLYCYLVTDEVWATQRAEYGYRDARPAPLVMTFAGHPYVDLRTCFNSFVPAALGDDLAGRLVEHYLDRLEAHPEFHDKVEFRVAFTCMTPDFPAAARERLAPAGFSDEEIDELRRALVDITQKAFDRNERDLATIEQLSTRFRAIIDADHTPLARARLLLEDCRRLGTLPFAHLARSGFVAMSLLRSLEAVGAIDARDVDAFVASLHTVVSDIRRDGARVQAGVITWARFVGTYGHLRPGTYDITSPSYGEDPERYLRSMVAPGDLGDAAGGPCWSDATGTRAVDALAAVGLRITGGALEQFLRTAIEGREYAKFIFTRNLNAALLAFAEFGRDTGLSPDDLSYLNVDALLRQSSETPLGDTETDLRRHIERETARHAVSQVIELPPVVTSEGDFWAFELPPSQPNFVTRHRVTAPIVTADHGATNLAGCIVLIPQADPGFDWLFGHDIAGLVTMYGGSNSHMTIRSAELDLPAAIGVGEALYERLAEATIIDLDCGARQIRVVS